MKKIKFFLSLTAIAFLLFSNSIGVFASDLAEDEGGRVLIADNGDGSKKVDDLGKRIDDLGKKVDAKMKEAADARKRAEASQKINNTTRARQLEAAADQIDAEIAGLEKELSGLNQKLTAVESLSDKGTVLPHTTRTVAECKALMNYISTFDRDERGYLFSKGRDFVFESEGFTFSINDIMACGIKTGGIKLWMIPYYIRYLLRFVVGLAGLIAIGGIVYGGYLYMFAGVSDEKEKGKKAIMYGVIGMVMTLLAWAFVNIVIAVVTA